MGPGKSFIGALSAKAIFDSTDKKILVLCYTNHALDTFQDWQCANQVPGTGKTTTARKLGQVFFDMGFLSSADVVECSATDLIGQYVGQTGPKTVQKLTEALGKVLFIDQAYRLGDGHFATEAINELVDSLTKPKFMGRIVVILAGYEADMNTLMSVNQGLSSRFPEELIFTNLAPKHCLTLRTNSLTAVNIDIPDKTEFPIPWIPKSVSLLI